MSRCAIMMVLLTAFCNAEDSCTGKSSCEDVSAIAKASAMLQVKATPHDASAVQIVGEMEKSSEDKADLMESHLLEARTCLPPSLPEKYLQALRRNAAFLSKKSRRASESSKTPTGRSWVGAGDAPDLSLPLRLDDIVYLKQPRHNSYLGACGVYGGEVTAKIGCDGAKHGLYAYTNKEPRTEYTVEVTNKGTFFRQANHGTYPGFCGGNVTGACSGAEKYAFSFPTRDDSTAFSVEDAGGSHYLQHKGTSAYLGVCSERGIAGCIAGGHDVLGYSTKDVSLLQQDPPRTTWEIQFLSRNLPEHDGSTAPVDAAGFYAVTSRCCPEDMEIFFVRLLDSMNMEVCSKPHVQGLMHWFSCTPDMDFEYLTEVINNGNPCKYWTVKGTACPALSPECEGQWCR